jgi:large subunit ribosomal protein L13
VCFPPPGIATAAGGRGGPPQFGQPAFSAAKGSSRLPMPGVIGSLRGSRNAAVFAGRAHDISVGGMAMKTFMAKPGEVEQRWWVVDASGRRVGRLASEIAMVLMGKHRPTYTPHVDTGDHVVVINADKVEFSGKKWQQKLYRWYTGYQGLKTETAEHRRDRKPELIIEEAVRRMLPKTRLGRVMLDKLKVYAGGEHPHQAQQPEPLELRA